MARKKKVQSKIIAGQTTVRFFFSGRNLEAAKIWRECYDWKKKRTVVWPAMFFGELHLY
jgi:hypothetical protein